MNFIQNLHFVRIQKTVIPTWSVGPDTNRGASTIATFFGAISPLARDKMVSCIYLCCTPSSIINKVVLKNFTIKNEKKSFSPAFIFAVDISACFELYTIINKREYTAGIVITATVSIAYIFWQATTYTILYGFKRKRL